jgi:hypothetical protein
MFGLELVMASHLLIKASSDVITCPAQKKARVDIQWRSEPIKYDYSATTAQLNAKPIDSNNPYGKHTSTDVGGLMSGNIEYKSKVGVTTLLYPTSRVACLWVDSVTIDIVIDPTINIAAEHPKGTCKHNAILEHEHKHVAIDREVVSEYMEKMRAAGTLAVQKVGVVGPKSEADLALYKDKMTSYVSDAVKTQADMMYAERARRQKGLDNKAEYDRVAAMCAK